MSAMSVDQFKAMSSRRVMGNKRDNREERLHIEVAGLLGKAGLLFYHGANEGDFPVQYRVKLKKKGTSPGFPDVMIFDAPMICPPTGPRPSGLAIELKAPDANGKRPKPRPNQLAWHEKLRRCGWRVEVCYTIDEVLAVLHECYPARLSIPSNGLRVAKVHD